MKYLDEQDVHLINGDEMRKILHALWMARALRAKEKQRVFWVRYELWQASPPKKPLAQFDKWNWVERKCRAKAKESE